MIYLACFAVSVFFAYLAKKSNKKINIIIFSVLSIAVTALLAGLRDYSIGIDTEHYFARNLYWDGAIKSATLSEYIYEYILSGYGEPLFALITGIISQITGSFEVFLTFVHVVIIGGVYIGAFRLKKYINPEFVLIIFYLFFYNHSLNILRQYMAMAIIFAFFADLLKKKYLRFLIVIIVAMQIHTTAMVAFGLLILHILLFVPKKLGTLKQREIGIAALLAVAVLGFAPLIQIAIKIGVLNQRYKFIFEGKKEPAIIIAGIVVLGIAAAVFFRKEIRVKTEHYDYILMCSICYLILLMLTFNVYASKRIALYFGLPDMITLGLVESAQTDKKKKWLVRIGIVGVAFVYWFYVYVFRNASETIPYMFNLTI